MSEARDQLRRLVEMARDASKASRADMAFMLADFWASPRARLTDQERALMRDILDRLLKEIETRLRTELADRLARSAAAPPELIEFLADQDIDVAGPILTHSPALRDEALIDLVRRRSREHRLAIAIRRPLSPDVSAALIEHGEDDVLLALTRNEGAVLSRRALEYLVAESERVDSLREPLVRRHDLPFDLAHRMLWWTSAALRTAILRKYDVNELVLDDFLEDVAAGALEEIGRGERTRRAAAALAESLDAARRLSLKDLETFLRQERFTLFVAALAQLTGLAATTVERLIHDMPEHGLAVTLRRLDAPRNVFASVFLLVAKMRGGGHRETRELEHALAVFDALEPPVAEAVVALWRREPEYQRAVEVLADVRPASEGLPG